MSILVKILIFIHELGCSVIDGCGANEMQFYHYLQLSTLDVSCCLLLPLQMQESMRERKSRIELPKVETKIPVPPPPPVLSWVDSLVDHTNLNNLQTLYLPLDALLIGGRNRLRKVRIHNVLWWNGVFGRPELIWNTRIIWDTGVL